MSPRMKAAIIGLQVLILGGLVTAAILLLSAGDGEAKPAAVPKPTVDRFDVSRAYALAARQVALGPRPPLSAAQRKAAVFLRAGLPNGRYESVPGGLRNIVGALPGRMPAVLVVAHYDTTDEPGYLGANNSAAAVGAVVEIARALRGDQLRAAPAVRFLLTDGEEAPRPFDGSDFYDKALRGSRAYVAAHAREIKQVVLLDFIGNRKLRLRRDLSSTTSLWEQLRAAARRVGVARVFPAGTQNTVLDDHTPFLRAGIPAIDLIDFDYACWQKPCDTMAQVSKASMDAAGEAVLELVRELRKH
jgi:glutaminyl-peptide cyclotransferase